MAVSLLPTRSRPLVWFGLSTLLALAAAALLRRYVGLEHTFYHWDHALYPGYADAIFQLERQQGWPAAFGAIRQSLADDFSKLFTVPAVLGFALQGQVTRGAYIIANFLAYGLGLAAMLALLLRQLRGGGYAPQFFIGLTLLLGCGFAWVSVVEGYPDMGGTMLLAAALALLLRHFPQVTGGQWLTAGILLAVAILYRRHFIYPAALLLAVSGAVQLFIMLRLRQPRAPGVYPPVLGPALAGVALLATLFLLAPAFVQRLLTMNYPELYASYAEDAAVLLDKDLSRVGALGLLATLAGYGLGWRDQPEQRARLAILLGLLLGWGLLWFGWVRFGGQHYLLQLLPILLPLGWALLWDALWTRQRLLAVGGLLLWLAQGLFSFWLADTTLPDRVLHPVQDRQWFTGLLAEQRPLRVRSDYDAIIGLAGYLQQGLRASDRVAVLASSPVFNQDILMAAVMARRASGGGQDFIPILNTPDIDRRDALPLDALSQATILLLVTPPQYHLAPEGQRVVGSAIAMLTEDQDFAVHWQRDAATYPLEQGATLAIWRLQAPWTPAERTAFLARLRARAAPSGSPPQDWVTARADLPVRSVTDERNRTRLVANIVNALPPVEQLFVQSLPTGSYQLQGILQPPPAGCAPQLRLRQLTGVGATLGLLPLTPDAQGRFAVLMPPQTGAATYLQLELAVPEKNAPSVCTLDLRELVVLAVP